MESKVSPLGPTVDDLRRITNRATRSVLLLIVREGLLRGISFGGSVVLARVLAPEMFGLYVVAWFVVHFFSHFSDIGLGEALIRKPDAPIELEYRIVFTLHLTLASGLLLLIYVAAPVAQVLYQAPEATVWLIRVMGVALFVSSWRTVPAVRLERSLGYDRLSAVDVVETLFYQGAALPLALAGFGVWSLVVASATSAMVGTITTYALSPWRPALAWHSATIRGLLRFGVPYQAQCFVHLAKDNLTPSLGGLLLGTTAVGYLNWAHSTARLPALFADMVNRVSLPAFARLLGDEVLLRSAVRDALRWASILTFGPLSILLGLAPQMISYVYTEKWMPALPALYVFGAEMVGGLLTVILIPLLHAAGRMGSALRLSLVWTGAIWLTAIVLIRSPLGFTGVAVAYAVGAAVVAVLLAREVRTVVDLAIWPVIRQPLMAGCLSFLASLLLGHYFINGLFSLALAGTVGASLFSLMLYALSGQQLLAEAKRLAFDRQ